MLPRTRARGWCGFSDEERAQRRELAEVARELDLGDRVVLGDAVPRAEIPRLLAGSDALVNNMREGATDKVVYEAAASCRLVVASNPVFDDFLDPEWRFPRHDPRALADRLDAVARATAEERAAIGRTLRARVEAGHSVKSWARGILDAVGIGR